MEIQKIKGFCCVAVIFFPLCYLMGQMISALVLLSTASAVDVPPFQRYLGWFFAIIIYGLFLWGLWNEPQEKEVFQT